MKPTEPLPLFHSWPITEAGRRFELGWVNDHPVSAPRFDADVLDRHAIGQWECDLADNSLTWSGAVYDIFGFPRGSAVARSAAAARYCEGSRAVMERLRAYAIRHCRGFTLDAEVMGPHDVQQWMRLTAIPVCVDNRVVRLVGTKRLIAA